MAVPGHDPHLLAERPGLLITAGKGHVSAQLGAYLAERGVRLLRPSYRNGGRSSLGVAVRVAQRPRASTGRWNRRHSGPPPKSCVTRSLISLFLGSYAA
nr:hypothetical protein [Nonomuraea pusilla]